VLHLTCLRRSVWLVVRAVRANEAEAALLHARAGGGETAHAAGHLHHPRRARGGGVLEGVLTSRFGKHRAGAHAGHHGAGGAGG
jgi:hypothetical protein